MGARGLTGGGARATAKHAGTVLLQRLRHRGDVQSGVNRRVSERCMVEDAAPNDRQIGSLETEPRGTRPSEVVNRHVIQAR